MSGELLERRVVDDGSKVFREGDLGDHAYIVQDGGVDIVKIHGAEEVCVGHVGRGGVFGEMALIGDQPRMATARAVGTTTLIVVSRRKFAEKMAAADPFMRALLGIFVRNIGNFREHGASRE